MKHGKLISDLKKQKEEIRNDLSAHTWDSISDFILSEYDLVSEHFKDAPKDFPSIEYFRDIQLDIVSELKHELAAALEITSKGPIR